MVHNSPINQLLQVRPDSIAFQVAEEIRVEIREELEESAQRRRTGRFEGSGGSKKGKFNKVKSKSKKTYKNKIKIKNKKSYRRRHHRHGK